MEQFEALDWYKKLIIETPQETTINTEEYIIQRKNRTSYSGYNSTRVILGRVLGCVFITLIC